MEAAIFAAIAVLALIPARGGSKGLPRKNMRMAAGRPLIAWTIEAAQASTMVSGLVLSSDDDEIIAAARARGCAVPFRRPPELATDSASTMDVVLHALDHCPGYEHLVLLQPTSPLRSGSDIDAAFQLLRERRAPSCVSVCLSDQSPYWMYRVDNEDRLDSVMPPLDHVSRRQDLPSIYVLNGAIYIARIDWLREKRSFISEDTVAYRMPVERSIDIDTLDDFEMFRRKVEDAP